MEAFAYAAPRTVAEAVRLLADAQGAARPLAGGTDLIPQLQEGRRRADLVVDVKGIPEMNEIRWDPEAGLTIGAAVPCAQVARSPHVQRHYPALHTACTLIGSIMIQHRASLGGNLGNAAPSADGVPPLMVYGAEAVIAGPGGTRRVPVEAVPTGPGQTCLAPGELIIALHLPVPPPHTGSHYLRFTPRHEMDIAVAGVGAAVTVDPATGACTRVRLALGAVAPTPVRAPEAEEYLTGKPLTREHVEEAARRAVAAARPISDVRGSADYRRHLIAVLTRRALAACRAQLEPKGGAQAAAG
ncbi:MAG: xanthine dehydrogenase family protein subunit M [Limnochordales bacterium]|nr:xanthine dehydrogenase family protein subunit M [Limnochordales bacterium]